MSSETGQTRRGFLRVAAMGTGAGITGLLAAPAVKPAYAAGKDQQPTFVFVAGSNGIAAAPPELALLGYRSVAVELPGHGPQDGQFPVSYQAPQDLRAFARMRSPMAGVRLDDFVARVVDVVRKVADYGPVILVGGSLGGATISRVGNAVPGLIHRIVYDTAFCCVDLPSVGAYFLTPEGSTSLVSGLAAGAIGDPAKIAANRTNWRSANRAFLANAKACFMANSSESEFLSLLNELHPDESVDLTLADARIDPGTWGRIPHTYVRHTLDRTIPLALQDRMIREADARTPHNRFDVRTVETTHVATPPKTGEIVKILASLASPVPTP
jgi:pimeloyl-ACP methyl ester carboxylesterase